MVLLPRGLFKTIDTSEADRRYKMSIPTVLFDESQENDIDKFLFLCDNVLMRGKSEPEKRRSIAAHLDGNSRVPHLPHFIRGCTLQEKEKDYRKVFA